VLQIDKYIMIGLSIIFIVVIFAYFSDESNIEYDYEGFVYDIRLTENGCTFKIESNDFDVYCYCSEIPIEFGYYAIKGSYSEDNTIFFVEFMFFKE